MASALRPNKRARVSEATFDITGKTIEVRVGVETFQVHKNLICSTSEFFKNAVKSEWGGDEKLVELKDKFMPVDTVRIYIKWLYSKNYDDIHKRLDAEMYWTNSALGYVFGESVMDPTFQQAIVDSMIKHMQNGNGFPLVKDVNLIYEGTVEGSPARRLMVDFTVWIDLPVNEMDFAEVLHKEYLNDLMRALLGERKPPKGPKSRPWLVDPKQYNVLAKGITVKQ